MSVPVIEMEGVCTRFGDVDIHRNLQLSIVHGEVVGLVGGSGSGKTTLLRQVLGLQSLQAGRIRLFGEELGLLDFAAARALRRRLGVLFQHGALFSALSVYDNIAFPLRELQSLDEAWIRQLVHLKLEMVELLPRHGTLMPAELSGGMVKRVALARALSLEPELLLLDEPTAGLDPDRSASFVRLIRQIQSELALTVLMVTHDLDSIKNLCSSVAVLADQRVVAHGRLDVVQSLEHPFIRNFFASRLVLHPEGV